MRLTVLWANAGRVGEELGADHQDTLMMVNNLAGLYESQARRDEAETFYIRALAGQAKQLGADCLTTMTIVQNLALLYKGQANLTRPKACMGERSHGRRSSSGLNHPHTLTTGKNLVALYATQGKHNEAKKPFARVPVGWEKHPSERTDIGEQPRHYIREPEENPRGRSALKASFSEPGRRLVSDHPATQEMLEDPIQVLVAQGRYQEAMILREQVY